MPQLSQITLVHKIVTGDFEALEQLLALKKKMIVFKIRSIIGNLDYVEDIAQEVAIRIFQRIDSLRKPEAFSGWLNTVIKRECIKYFAVYRQPAPAGCFIEIEECVDLFTETDTDCLPMSYTERTELEGEIKTALGCLNETGRKMFVLHYLSGKCYREVAAIMGMSIGTVCSYLYRARRRIQKELVSAMY